MFKSPQNLPVCHGSGPMDAPRAIVVVVLDLWTPCHVSTSPSPVVDSPSYKKNTMIVLMDYVGAHRQDRW